MPDREELHIVVSEGNIIHQFGLIFDFATIGIIVTDQDGKLINFNPFAEKQFGYTKDEIVGQNVAELFPEKYDQYHHHFTEESDYHTDRGIVEGIELTGMKKNGAEFPVKVSLSPYTLNERLFIITFVEDITVRKQQEALVSQQKKALEEAAQEVKQLNVELEQRVQDRTKMLREALAELERSKQELAEALENEKHAGELKSRFVTMASHEFRTPLSTILSSAFLLEKYNDGNDKDKRLKHIHRIRNSVAGLKSILDDFLSLGRFEEGHISYTDQVINSVEIRELISRVIADMEQQLKPGQQITFKCDTKLSIHTDIEILKNIIVNLLTNAIKFSGENKTIEMECADAGSEFSIAVRDEGIGISKEDQKHLFERFFRAKNAVNIQGTGLGLHIVQKYLEMMNGRIEIESVPEKGSSFTIFIPKS